MKQKQLFIVYILNFLGLLGAIAALYFIMFETSITYAIGSGIISIIFIILSFVFHRPKEPESSTNEEILIPISSIESPSTERDQTINEETSDFAGLVIEETPLENEPFENEIDLGPTEIIPLTPRPTLSKKVQFKFNDSQFESNILSIQNELISNRFSIVNESYTYRLEALLKLDNVDKKVWEVIYDPFPYIGLSRKGDDLIVNVGIDKNEMIPIGVLPKTAHSYVEDRSKVALNAQLVSGNFRYISSKNHSFETYSEPSSIILTLIRKD